MGQLLATRIFFFLFLVFSFVALRSRKKELVLIAVAQYVNVKGKYVDLRDSDNPEHLLFRRVMLFVEF